MVIFWKSRCYLLGKIRHLAVMPPTRMNMFAAATYRPIYKLFHEFQELAFLGRCAAPSIGRFADCFERCNFDWIAVEAILFDSFDPAPSSGWLGKCTVVQRHLTVDSRPVSIVSSPIESKLRRVWSIHSIQHHLPVDLRTVSIVFSWFVWSTPSSGRFENWRVSIQLKLRGFEWIQLTIAMAETMKSTISLFFFSFFLLIWIFF